MLRALLFLAMFWLRWYYAHVSVQVSSGAHTNLKFLQLPVFWTAPAMTREPSENHEVVNGRRRSKGRYHAEKIKNTEGIEGHGKFLRKTYLYEAISTTRPHESQQSCHLVRCRFLFVVTVETQGTRFVPANSKLVFPSIDCQRHYSAIKDSGQLRMNVTAGGLNVTNHS